jgi:nitroreductase
MIRMIRILRLAPTPVVLPSPMRYAQRTMSDAPRKYPFVPYRPGRISHEESIARGRAFRDKLDGRRSVRAFSPDAVPREAIELAIAAASTSPSGAHRQPWTFVAIDDPAIKHEIRLAAEREERESYEGGRMPTEWLEALAPLGTDWHKPYLETAPYLVVVFEQIHGFYPDGRKRKNYYVRESVGLACGLFIAALHEMGLSTLTHTPSPMAFLTKILGRPSHERPFILFPIGYPTDEAQVPDLRRKTLDEVAVWNPTASEG